ncbi:MAG: hypothetical protein Q7S87_14005 [Agitococcus sp.]|nr:hypothetical protein [Agitococcus sp.]
MSTKHQILFYPVGNGDTSQIILSNKRRILMDYRHQLKGEDPTSPVIDLKARLKKELKDAGRDNFDVVVFTHADSDHISGSTDFFELNHALKYQGNGRIKIDELWVPAAMVIEHVCRDQQSDEFAILRREAQHRLLEGKGIRVFSKPPALAELLERKLKERGEAATARDHLIVDAGTIVSGFTLEKDGVEFFCHSPFIKHCPDGDVVRNDASLIFNIRFEAEGNRYDYLAVGDAEWSVLEDIVSTTRYHGNDDRLAWDLFNVPHHCSYLALSDTKGDNETEPKPLVKDLLLMGKRQAYEVVSSRPIEKDKDAYLQIQPPHVQAYNTYQRYLDKVGGRRILVTMETPNKKHPEPLVFDVTYGGVSWIRSAVVGATALAAAAPVRAGKSV